MKLHKYEMPVRPPGGLYPLRADHASLTSGDRSVPEATRISLVVDDCLTSFFANVNVVTLARDIGEVLAQGVFFFGW